VLGKRVLKRIDADGVTIGATGVFRPHLLETRVGSDDDEFLTADTVVLGTARRPQDALFEELLAAPGMRGVDLHLIGDAGVPRTVTEATAGGVAAARSVCAREGRGVA
jgi:hypothetical protein